jgi:phospholipid/cholesterol/gamma-HCH transport system substrate-binding protein
MNKAMKLKNLLKEASDQWNDVTYNISVDVERIMPSIYAKLSKEYTNEYKGKNLEFSTWKGSSRIKQGTGIVNKVEIEMADDMMKKMEERMASCESKMAEIESKMTEMFENYKNKFSAIDNTINSTTKSIKDADMYATIKTIQNTLVSLNTTINQLNNGNGTASKLLNDPAMYTQLQSTINSVNTLVDDIKVHPKRYINVSVFGKKDKNKPLTTPLPDTMNAPYTK